MPKYIKKKDLKNAIDECTWYHIGKGGELVEGANSSEHEPLYKYSDIKEIIKNLPTRKFEAEPKRTALSKALKWTYGDEPNCSEKPNNCEVEPQTDVEKIVWHKDCGWVDKPKYDAEEVAKDINRRVDIGQRLETMSCQECKYWKYIAKEWQCSVEKCQYEPQTDCSWK